LHVAGELGPVRRKHGSVHGDANVRFLLRDSRWGRESLRGRLQAERICGDLWRTRARAAAATPFRLPGDTVRSGRKQCRLLFVWNVTRRKRSGRRFLRSAILEDGAHDAAIDTQGCPSRGGG
jgi:hypothetical protein